MKAVIFPGQGIQKKGMGAALMARYPNLVKEASDLLGYDIHTLCLDDPNQQLNQTEFTQPAIYLVSWLGYLAAREDGMSEPDFLLGHSVGEYAALTAAGAMTMQEGLSIVQQRATLMSRVQNGGLAALIDCPPEQLTTWLAEERFQSVAVANRNSHRQVVVGGPEDTLQKLLDECRQHQQRGLMLKVSGPFHTRLMESASQAFLTCLQQQSFAEMTRPVIANLTAQPHRQPDIADTLAQHIARPVNWIGCVEYALQQGVDEFIEIGQPPILTPMVENIRHHFVPSEPQRPQTSQPIAAAPSAFCTVLGCDRPMLAGPLCVETLSDELLDGMIQAGTVPVVDVAGQGTGAAREALQQLASHPSRLGRCLPNLSLLEVCQFSALNDLIRDFNLPALMISIEQQPDISRLQWISSLREHTQVILRVPHKDIALACLQHADALYVELAQREQTRLPSLDPVLELLDAVSALPQAQRPWLGVGGLAGSSGMVSTLLAMGVDFVGAGSVFLATREAPLNDSVKQSLRQVRLCDYQPLPDWRFPGLGSCSFSYVIDQTLTDESQHWQRWFLNADQDWPEDVPNQSAGLLDTRWLQQHARLAPQQQRSLLQQRIRSSLSRAQLAGDASLLLMNRSNEYPAPVAVYELVNGLFRSAPQVAQ